MKSVFKTVIILFIGIFSPIQASSDQGLPPPQSTTRPFIHINMEMARKSFENDYANQAVAAFRVDIEAISSLNRGELLELGGIDGSSYTLKVEEKHYFKNYTLLLLKCSNKELDCHGKIIIGSTNTIMYLQSNDNNYEMESRNEIAYFYKSAP